MVLRNINSRIRYNGLSSKEILFRRNNLTNEPIQIDDDQIRTKQSVNREASSKASQKSKSRTQVKTGQQLFNIGDRVLLRNTCNKNNPRETYIVEDTNITHRGYVLIRKLGNKLRNKLYNVHPDEIILAPISQKNTHSEQSDGNIQLKTRSGRPLRCAAMNKSYDTKTLSRNQRTYTCKHGWIPEDQNYESDFYIISSEETADMIVEEDYATSEEPSPDTSITLQDTVSGESTEVQDLEESELSLDESPEQYLFSYHSAASDSHPSNLSQDQERSQDTHVQPYTRRLAVSERPLVRSDAFRRQLAPSRRSRIPLPTSPSQVNLREVSDITEVASIVFSRLEFATPPNTETPTPEHPKKRSPQVRQPSNYSVFHLSGKRGEDGEEKKK